MNRLLKSKKKGSALVLVVLGAVIISALGVGMLRLGLSRRIYAIRTAQDIEARCAADAGLTKAVHEMNEKLKVKPWSESSLPSTTNESLLNCDGLFSYTVTGSSVAGFSVTSTGNCIQAQRTLKATLRLKAIFEGAIVTQGPLILKAGMTVGGYNSADASDTDVDVKIATTSTTAEHLVLNNGVVVDGDIFVGVNGDPSVVIRDEGATTGYRSSLTEELDFPVITPPTFAGPGTDIDLKGANLTIGPADTGVYTTISLKRTVAPSVLEIAGGDVVLYVTGNINMGQDCEIVIAAGSSLTLYLDGDLVAANNSGFNNLTSIPTNFTLYGTGGPGQLLDIKAKSDAFGAIYAPNAAITVMASGDIYGSVVGASFEIKAGGNFYYDEALSKVDTDDEGVRFIVERWSE
ncbi:MAG: DUF7305 domain-containing protein [Planctomycetota bacterium]|jgi:hypothetical protein